MPVEARPLACEIEKRELMVNRGSGRSNDLRVAVIGSGYVGSVVAACFASLGRRVVGVEIDEGRLQTLREGRAPFHERGLDELLASGLASGALTFTADMAEAVASSDVIFLCVGTPSNNGSGADLGAVEAAARTVGQVLDGPRILVMKSTVPMGTVGRLGSVIEAAVPPERRNGWRPTYVANPEFLRQGTAVHDFLHPDRVVLGSDDPDALEIVGSLYRPILEQDFAGVAPRRRPRLVRTSLTTAEAIKYASNAFLATKVSFINEIAAICDATGADVAEVAAAMGLDPRIGPLFLQAGIGWGGSCFGKDLEALIATARKHGHEPALLEKVIDVNRRARGSAVEKLRLGLDGLEGRRIAILGLAFKPGTDDMRDSAAVEIAGRLLEAGADVVAHDPVVTSVRTLAELRIAPGPYDAVRDADAVLIATEWPDYLEMDLEKVAELMRGDLLLDGRNALDPESVVGAGLRFEGMGRPQMSPPAG